MYSGFRPTLIVVSWRASGEKAMNVTAAPGRQRVVPKWSVSQIASRLGRTLGYKELLSF